jgi:hypothetical protein
MSALTGLANLHGTDKGTIGPTSFWPGSNYTDVYEAYLHPLRSRPIDLLEIGLGVKGERWQTYIANGRNAAGGASVKMWSDYFPQARIYGIDVNPAGYLDDDRVTTAIVDQGDRDELEAFLASLGDVSFDLIVDDGSHRPDHQQISLSVLFPRLKPGGLYFIEDLMDNGKGDPDRGRFSAPEVLNTRAVLRPLASGGEFAAPNALLDGAELAAAIESVSFHVPPTKIESQVPPGAKDSQEPRRVVRYEEGREKLCVLRKTLAGRAAGFDAGGGLAGSGT